MAIFRPRKNQPGETADVPEVANTSVAESVEVAEASGKKPKRKGIFSRIKAGLKKTTAVLNTDLRDIFKEGRRVDDDFLRELFEVLIKTDMGLAAASEIRDRIGSEFRARKVEMDQLVGSAKATITGIMAQAEVPINYAESGPTVVMVCGVNGSGKTTSIAKLAHMFKQQGKSVVLGAGDTFRAAAVAQLEVWAQRIGAEIVTGRQGSDPASVAYQAVAKADEIGADICIVDTAGRLQTQVNLMQQLTKIRRVMSKVVPDAPHEVLLVIDATAGQNGISQARGFSEAAECTGIILAKLDGTAKGGVVIPIRKEFDLPVKYVGLGETPEDLMLFNVDQYVDALFDDVVSSS
ncbi:MAG: signal recognition particle-docking protein FtsY [Planctomycetes bacterium]|nr:signal recognition particle-docking protein FtsY [Planctomycetota bacterium]